MKLKKKVETFDVVDREILKNLLKKDIIDWYFFHENTDFHLVISRSMKNLQTGII